MQVTENGAQMTGLSQFMGLCLSISDIIVVNALILFIQIQWI